MMDSVLARGTVHGIGPNTAAYVAESSTPHLQRCGPSLLADVDTSASETPRLRLGPPSASGSMP